MFRAAGIVSSLVFAAVGLTAAFRGDAQGSKTALPAAAQAGAPAVAQASVQTSFRFPEKDRDRPAEAPAAPVSLTASDGTGLRLVALSANGVLEPPLAFTELSLTFDNPRDQVIEGRFRIALPPGAALSRFAMKIGDAWQEGEVVERQRARVAYEDFLHRRQDPALLEQEAGNEFSARVFPIPARGQKEIVVSYSHALARADEPYVLPLLGLPEIGALDVRVLLGERDAGDAAGSLPNIQGAEVRDQRMVELHRRAWTPDRDFEIGQDRVAARPGLVHENLAVLRLTVPAEPGPEERQEVSGLYVLVDSSASRTLGWPAQVERVGALLAGLRAGAGASTPVAVAAFDQEVAPVYEGPASGFGAAELARLSARRPLGASDFAGALAWLGEHLAGEQGKYPRVLLVTDGVATAGETEARALKAAVRALGERGVERLDVLAAGGLRDEALLAELVTGNLRHDGQRIAASAPLPEVARRLTHACRSGMELKVDGAAWAWPQTLDGVQPGDTMLVYADLPAGRRPSVFLAGKPVLLGGELLAAERPLLERAWVQARIERLLHLRETAHAEDEDLRAALVHEVVDLSVRHRVLSPYTALLVLETDADYERFGLERTALANVLTVGPGGLDVLARTRPSLSPPPAGRSEVARKQRVIDGSGALSDATRQDRADLLAQPTPEDRDDPEAIVVTSESPLENADADGIAGGVSGGIEGGVAGGVVGGVVGGMAGGVVGSTIAEVPPAPAVPPPPPGAGTREESDDSPLRAGSGPAAPRPVPQDSEPLAETISVGAGSQARQRLRRLAPADEEGEEKEESASPYSGRFADVMRHLAAGGVAQARAAAEAWSAEAPGDVLALVALGEAWEAAGDRTAAARAYGSLIDLFPARADLRRYAGERLERLGEVGLPLAIDTYEKAVAERPDHPAGHRLLAWALLRAGRPAEAFAALEKGLTQRYPGGRFAGVDRILKEDLGLLAAAWLRAEPDRRAEVLDRLASQGAARPTRPSLRFVLTWETDANDVDLHVHDGRGGHAYYEHPDLPSGGQLYADVTTGYGPECFAVETAKGRSAGPYRLQAHYYNRGPMGYGMGLLQVIEHDGEGKLTLEPRPFVVMADRAMLDLGKVPVGKEAGGRVSSGKPR